jgi:catechol 2,3-dioxygenase-like lactoylglutathione lyase family enzyme
MFSHITIGMNDLGQTKAFYDAIMGVIGAGPAIEPPGGTRLMYNHKGGMLMLTQPVNGQPASGANGGTIGFELDSPEQVVAWHEAGCANGGTSCEDPPGVRPAFNMFLAYLRDPAGNKLCGLHRLG